MIPRSSKEAGCLPANPHPSLTADCACVFTLLRASLAKDTQQAAQEHLSVSEEAISMHGNWDPGQGRWPVQQEVTC